MKKNIDDNSQLKLGLNGDIEDAAGVKTPVAEKQEPEPEPVNVEENKEIMEKNEKSEKPDKAEKNQKRQFPLPATASIGSFLMEARTKADLSLNQVATITKIHIHYLEAVEREDFKSSPPFIYVKAYVKKLCDLYGTDQDYAVQLLMPHFKTIENKVPDAIIQTLEENKQVDVKEQEKVRLWFRNGLIFVLSMIVLIVAIFIFSGKRKYESRVGDKPLSISEKLQLSKDMEKLIVPQSLGLREIKTPGNSTK